MWGEHLVSPTLFLDRAFVAMPKELAEKVQGSEEAQALIEFLRQYARPKGKLEDQPCA